MSEDKYHCTECNKELEVSFVRLQMMIDESYKLKTQNNKLINFVKLIDEHNVPYYADQAKNLLIEIGEI